MSFNYIVSTQLRDIHDANVKINKDIHALANAATSTLSDGESKKIENPNFWE